MKTKINSLVALACLTPFLATPTEAAVAVIGLTLTGTGSLASYTVPAGKVLLIENLSAGYSGNVPATSRIVLQIGLLVQNGAIATMYFGYPIADKFTAAVLTRPLRVPEGRTLSLYTAGNVGYDDCRIQGLLVDAADLYAANIAVDLKAFAVEGGRFKAEAQLATPRPAQVMTKTSIDLASFAANTTAKTSKLPGPGKWEVSTAADSNRKFLVARATAREIR